MGGLVCCSRWIVSVEGTGWPATGETFGTWFELGIGRGQWLVCSMEYPRCGFAVRYEHDPRGIFRRFHALRGIGF